MPRTTSHRLFSVKPSSGSQKLTSCKMAPWSSPAPQTCSCNIVIFTFW